VVYRFDFSKEFKVMSVVVLLGGGEHGRVVSYWVALSWGGWACSFILGEDCSDSILRCVGLKVEHFVKVGLSQDWFTDHSVPEFFKGLLLVVFPVPWCGLLGKVQEGVCYLRVVFDKMLIVAGESQELSDFSHIAGSHPGLHLVDLGLFHFYHPCRHSNTQEVKVVLLEGTFFWVEVKVIFAEPVKDLSD
jgi:hypothetical protein